MNKEVDKSQDVPELFRLYRLKQISLEKLLVLLALAGVTASLIQNHDGDWACFQNNWTYFTNKKGGTEVRMWLPSSHWKETPRAAVLFLLEKLAKDKFVYLLKKDSAEDQPDFSGDDEPERA